MHSRCDLSCDHCYIYEHADTQWRGRPKATPEDVLAQTARRIAEHAGAHRLKTVHVVLHGGEPLLAGVGLIRHAAEQLQRALPADCGLDLRIHTNGVTLDRKFCELFAKYDIKVGISLDGDRVANDLHRRYADGRSSHSKVLKAVRLLQEPPYRHLFAGLLCTIDVRNDPIAVYEALLELDPPRIDFLLPHATWDHPPLRPDGPDSTPYAEWLGTIYDHWDAHGRPVPVRTFDSVLRTLRGLSSLTENLGLEPADLVVIETDGTLEQADSLRTAFDGAAGTGFNVFDHPFDLVARHPGMMDRQHGLADLSADCQSCPVVRSCGGGLYAHRYREGSGFDNPSVFCGDLFAFISKVARQESAVPENGETEPENPLTEQCLAELALGYGGADSVAVLIDSQLDLSRGLLATVQDLVDPKDPVASVAWDLLTALDDEVPEALDVVVAHPYTRAWAVRCLSGESPDDAARGLAELAAGAALRAGVDAPVAVPLRDGVLRLPGLGRLLVGTGDRALVRATDDGFRAETDGAPVVVRWADGPDVEPRWQPVRRVTVDARWTVALEDTDPERDRHGYPVADRLADDELTAWTADLAEAWRLITRALPGYADGIAVGLHTVTPLLRPDRGRDISSSARHAFGAVGIARPAAADTLALLLVHEFQHVKLGAVLDRHDLFDPDDERLFYAPWRPDPRPLEGLFQGTYAHVAVTEYWRSRLADLRELGAPGQAAELEFARWRMHTAEALNSLTESDSLTPLGAQFVDGMRATVSPWLDEPVSGEAMSAAQQATERTLASWLAHQRDRREVRG